MDLFFQNIFNQISEQTYNPRILENEEQNDTQLEIYRTLNKLKHTRPKRKKNIVVSKTRKHSEKNEEQICSICLERIEKGNRKILSYCLHAFHESCIDTWVHLHRTCPQCRSNI